MKERAQNRHRERKAKVTPLVTEKMAPGQDCCLLSLFQVSMNGKEN